MENEIIENIRYKILLVEDNKLDQAAFARMIEEQELSYDCTMADSVAQAMDILSSKHFDIIIADYSLGDGTAFDILDLSKGTPVIFVTGAGDEEIAINAWKTGAYGYLIKDPESNYLKTLPITVENTVKHQRMEFRLQLLSHAIVSTDDSIYITDLEDKVTFVNRAFCETYGYTEEEIIGKDCDILWKQPSSDTTTENICREGNGWEVGFLHTRKDGSQFPVSLSRSDVTDESGNEVAMVVISRNISERMQVENELRAENQELDRQIHFKKDIALATCQQLTESTDKLTSIISTALVSRTAEIGPDLRKDLELAEKNIDNIKMVVDNFIEISDAERQTAQSIQAGH